MTFTDKPENAGLPSHVYQQVADLEAQIAALKQEVEILGGRQPMPCGHRAEAGYSDDDGRTIHCFECRIDALTQEREGLQCKYDLMLTAAQANLNALAASQAREAKLREIIAKMRADLKAIGGFENRFSGQPAVNIREYIFDLEGALDPIDDTALQQRLAEERERCIRVMFESDDLFIAESSIRSMT